MANEQINQLVPLGLPVQGTDKLIVQRGAARATALEVKDSGLVTGPAVATNSAVALYDGIGGKLLKDGPVLGNSSTRNVGAAAGTVAAGDDARIVAGGTAVQPAAIANMVTAAAVIGATKLVVGSGGVRGVAESALSGIPLLTSGVPSASNVTNDAQTKASIVPNTVTVPAGPALMNVLGVVQGDTAFGNKVIFDATAPEPLGVSAAGTSLTAAHRDHVHTMPTAANVGAAAATHAASHVTGGADIIQSADTTHVGLAPAVTAPAAGFIKVLAVANGETVRTDKELFVAGSPAAIGTAAAGTAITAARSDHVHSASLDNLSDVIIATPVIDQFLRFNGTDWVNSPGAVASASPGIEFFADAAVITATGANNANVIETLLKIPRTAAQQPEVIEAFTPNNNTVFGNAYLYDLALGRTTLDAGTWTFDTYCSVNTSTAGSPRITRAIYQVVPGVDTLSTVRTSTNIAATAASGTPFVAGDGTASLVTCGYLQTPQGLYPITTGATGGDQKKATCTVPVTYANETNIAAGNWRVWKLLFSVNTGDIPFVGTNYGLISTQSVQGAFTVAITDKLGCIVFASATANKVINFLHNGAVRASHFQTPFTTLHGNLAGLQGGTGAVPAEEYYHLTLAQHTAATAAAAQATASIRAISTATPQAIGSAAAGNGTDAAAGNHVHAIPAGHVTTLQMQNGGTIQCAMLTSIWA